MRANAATGPVRSLRLLALAFSLLFNAALIFAVLQVRFEGLKAPEPVVELVIERPPPPPPPPPPEEEKKPPPPKSATKVARNVSQKMAKREQKTLAPSDPGPPIYALDPSGDVAQGSGAVGGGQSGTGRQRGNNRLGMYAPSDYADRVKSQIIANKVYPAEARQKLQECFVSYTVTVDGKGNMLAYDIDPCGHPLLDAAVREAILKAAPFPVPPDMGAERYDIHGSLVFRLK